MRYGIVAGTIPGHLPYASIVQTAAEQENFSAALPYAVAWRETIRGERNGKWNAASVISGDGGRGLFQLTSSYPDDWERPDRNCHYALEHFLKPARDFFVAEGLLGEALIRCIAASFNAGIETAWEAHLAGDVDRCTTGCDYAADVFHVYSAIISGHPFS